MIDLSSLDFLWKSKQGNASLPGLRSNQTEHTTYQTNKNSRYKMPVQSLFAKIKTDLNHQECQERLNHSMESINELMEKPQTKVIKEFFKLDRLKSLNAESYNFTLEQAEECFRSPAKRTEERAIAARVVAEQSLRSVYGGELPKIEGEGHTRPVRKYKNRLNTKILGQILNEIEHNARSHSIVLRKSELEQIQAQFNKSKAKKTKFSVLERASLTNSEDERLQFLYKLKNRYQTLKDFIIVTKSQEFEEFAAQFEKVQRIKETRRTHKMNTLLKGTNLKSTRGKLEKQNKQSMQDIETCKSFRQLSKSRVDKTAKSQSKRPKGKFELSRERLVMENISQLSPSAFLFMMTQCRFEQIKTVRIKLLNVDSNLLYFMLDCMRKFANSDNKMDSFELMNTKVQSISKLGDKLAALMEVQPIRCIKLELLELNNRQLSKITDALQDSRILSEFSLRSNKIDILGVRHIESLCRNVPSIEAVDMRMNEIPHYANLKDKSSVIQFF